MVNLRTNRLKIVIILLIVIISRIPFIFNSLGVDCDIWREMFSGKVLKEEHMYNASRFPGYPFSEFLFSVIYNLPYWAINFFSVLFTAGCSIVFYLILEQKKIQPSLLLSIALSFVPIIFLSSTISIDYNRSLFFILCAVYCTIKGKYMLASVFFGLLVSSRFNNIIFLLPFVYLVFFQSKDYSKAFKFILYSLFFSALFFMPVIVRYRGDFFYHYGTISVPLKTYMSLSTLHVFGFLGSVVLFLIFFHSAVFYRKVVYERILALRQNHFFIFCLLFVAVNFLFFLKFPLEPGYLIPGLPFVFIIFVKIFERRQSSFFAYAIILSPFILFVNTDGFKLKGVAFINEEIENQQIENTHRLISEINKLPGNSMVSVGNIYEHLILIKGNEGLSNKRIFKLLSKDEIEKLKKDNIPFYYTEEAGKRTLDKFNYNLGLYGKVIDIELKK